MTHLKGQTAVVFGAGSGVGRATLCALAGQGARVTGVARTRERLERVVREAPGEAVAEVGDATDPAFVRRLLDAIQPGLVVVSLGAQPRLAALDEQTWESFSAVWNTDVQATFHICQAALRSPLPPGSTVVILSSGAAVGGSPLSGGYAGAKRMQWFLGGYAQRVSTTRNLGLRFVTLVPRQLLVGTEIGEAASMAYAAEGGISQEKYMERFGAPLLPGAVAEVIVQVARGELGTGGGALAVTGRGTEPLG